MAALTTNTVTLGTINQFEVLMNAFPSNTPALGVTYGFDPFPAAPSGTIQYIQRVYSSGLSAWCYYTKTSIDPAPLSGETTPNWTGSISGHQVLAVLV